VALAAVPMMASHRVERPQRCASSMRALRRRPPRGHRQLPATQTNSRCRPSSDVRRSRGERSLIVATGPKRVGGGLLADCPAHRRRLAASGCGSRDTVWRRSGGIGARAVHRSSLGPSRSLRRARVFVCQATSRACLYAGGSESRLVPPAGPAWLPRCRLSECRGPVI
jgi:hypothetical protein